MTKQASNAFTTKTAQSWPGGKVQTYSWTPIEWHTWSMNKDRLARDSHHSCCLSLEAWTDSSCPRHLTTSELNKGTGTQFPALCADTHSLLARHKRFWLTWCFGWLHATSTLCARWVFVEAWNTENEPRIALFCQEKHRHSHLGGHFVVCFSQSSHDHHPLCVLVWICCRISQIDWC